GIGVQRGSEDLLRWATYAPIESGHDGKVKGLRATGLEPVRRSLAGWGRTAPSVASVQAMGTDEQVADAVGSAGPRGVVVRGLGRSYGDAAQNGGGSVLDLTGRDRILDVDAETGVVVVEAGLSLDRLMRDLLPNGWFVPVTPGTRFVTVGGAIAADVHGKNHHVDGSFGSHVRSIDLLDAQGRIRRLSPSDPLFWATVGGMGLTGVILRATVAMTRVETSSVIVDTLRCRDLDALMAAMGDDDRYPFSVAWVDCLARGDALGRSVLTRGRFALQSDLTPRRRREPLAFAPRSLATVPDLVPPHLLNRLTVAAFNEAWFRKAPGERRGEVQGIASFFHPLDGVAHWNRVYGARGFLQYQIVVPDGCEDVIRACVEAFSASGTASFLAVLKRLGEGNAGHLSFPRRGWTLALDLPAGAGGLSPMLDHLDLLVVEAGGRSYLAKDSRMTPETVRAMYPRLSQWQELRHDADPRGVFTSDLARRLHL
ncbi:MAG: FAD-binding oxidoreductase, partial [Nostocoides sp.]